MIELISIQQIKKPAPLLVIKPRFADSFDGTIQMNTLRQNFHIVLITFFSLSNFWVCGPNSVVWPFKWKLFGNTITWYYLVFSSLRLYFFWILIFAYHAIEPKGWISDTKTLQSMERKLLDKDRWMKQKKNQTGWQIQQSLDHIHQIQEELTVLKFTYAVFQPECAIAWIPQKIDRWPPPKGFKGHCGPFLL